METESAEPRVAQHQEHVEPAGRVHRVVVPRLHLRAQSVALEQPAGRPRRHAAPFGGGGAGRRLGRPVALQLAQLAQVADAVAARPPVGRRRVGRLGQALPRQPARRTGGTPSAVLSLTRCGVVEQVSLSLPRGYSIVESF